MVHRVLERQLRKVGVDDPSQVPQFNEEQWQTLLERISSAYDQSEKDRYTIERSLEISSQEGLERSRALQFQKTLLEYQQEASLDGLMMISQEGKIISHNKRFRELWSWLPGIDGAIEKNDTECLWQEIGAAIEIPKNWITESIAASKTDLKQIFHKELILVNYSIFEIYSAPVTDSSGVYYGRLWRFRDVTEDRNKALKLAEETARSVMHQQTALEFSGLFNATFEAILILDGQKILDVNDSFTRLFKCNKDDVVGTSALEFIAPESRDTFLHETKDKNSKAFEILGVRGNGSSFFVEVLSKPYTFRSNVVTLVSLRDLTEKKQNEEVIAKQQAQITSTAKMSALGEMAGAIAHEINNPLAIIDGKAKQILRLVTRNSDPKLEFIQQIMANINKIVETVTRMSKIIKGLRSFASESGSVPMELYSVAKIIEESLDLCREKFKVHGIYLKMPTQIPNIDIECRPIEIEQVIVNLLNNANHAVEDKTDKWVEVTVDDMDTCVKICVIDCGTGIPKPILDKIFQPFFTTKEIGKGTGIGLSISKGIIENHQGWLQVDESHPNTCFEIVLPKVQKKKNILETQKESGELKIDATVEVKDPQAA